MNDLDVLTTMYGPLTDGLRPTMRICGAHGCWQQANERGYRSSFQLKQDKA